MQCHYDLVIEQLSYMLSNFMAVYVGMIPHFITLD